MAWWEDNISKILNNRNNKEIIGVQIGTIESVKPLKVSLLKGEILLDKDELFICDALYQKEYKASLTGNVSNSGVIPEDKILLGDLDTSSKELGNYTTINNRQETFNYTLTKFEINEQIKIDVKLNNILSLNQKVLMIPFEEEQKWIIIDTVRGVDF